MDHAAVAAARVKPVFGFLFEEKNFARIPQGKLASDTGSNNTASNNGIRAAHKITSSGFLIERSLAGRFAGAIYFKAPA